jgi:hypothetical protein
VDFWDKDDGYKNLGKWIEVAAATEIANFLSTINTGLLRITKENVDEFNR